MSLLISGGRCDPLSRGDLGHRRAEPALAARIRVHRDLAEIALALSFVVDVLIEANGDGRTRVREHLSAQHRVAILQYGCPDHREVLMTIGSAVCVARPVIRCHAVVVEVDTFALVAEERVAEDADRGGRTPAAVVAPLCHDAGGVERDDVLRCLKSPPMVTSWVP